VITDPLKDLQGPPGLKESVFVLTLFSRLLQIHNRSKNTAEPYPITINVWSDGTIKKRRVGFRVHNPLTKKEAVVTIDPEPDPDTPLRYFLYAVDYDGISLMRVPFYKGDHVRVAANHLFRYLRIN